MKTLFRIYCICAISLIMHGQTAPQSASGARSGSDIPGARAVTVGDFKPILGLSGSIAHTQVHCDAEGNIYLPLVPPNTDSRVSYLRRVSRDGVPQTTFLQRVSGQFVMGAEAFGANGEVVMLPSGARGTRLLRFSADGELVSDLPFAEQGIGRRLAPFPNGNLLISFRQKTHALTGIYDREGKLIARTHIPDDVDIEKAIEQRDSRYVEPLYPDQTNRAVDLGSAIAGPDGNVYLMRYGHPAFVYVINSEGKILRRHVLVPPRPGMTPSNFQVRQGVIAILFEDNNPYKAVLSVHDWQTGQRTKLYDVTPIPGYFSCYDAQTERLTYINSTHDMLTIGFAKPSAVLP